jgi:two-component system sensor histidine kinase KdpD
VTGHAHTLDLHAVIARRPAIVLVDDLAHDSLADGRVQQRWQDVTALLDAGIDVLSTMDIWHLARLNDIVFHIMDVRIPHTIPDAVFERIDDLRLVDLPARELIERRHQGKAMLPGALSHLPDTAYSLGNLTALRALAMHTVAAHIDASLHLTPLADGLAGIAIQSLGRHLAQAVDLPQVMRAGCEALATSLHAQAWVYINGQTFTTDQTHAFSEHDVAASDWTQTHGQASGRFTETHSQAAWWFLPIRTDDNTFGVVGIRFKSTLHHPTSEVRRLAEAMVEDIAQAALRARLVADLEVARVTSETERLRSALLSSVSHDLRSPLSSMIGAADSLASYRQAMSEEDQQSLLQMIHTEGERLDRYIQNLLDMTRLGQEGLTLARDWIGIDELIGSATRRLQRYLPHVTYDITLPAHLPPIHVHPALIEQALFNVLENAAKFSPPGQAIHVGVLQTPAGQLQIDIADQGPGIPEEERLRIFDMFYSVERGDRGKNGTGLGLAIVQGIIGAHMGRVTALPGNNDTGTLIRLTLPWGEAPTPKASTDDKHH